MSKIASILKNNNCWFSLTIHYRIIEILNSGKVLGIVEKTQDSSTHNILLPTTYHNFNYF